MNERLAAFSARASARAVVAAPVVRASARAGFAASVVGASARAGFAASGGRASVRVVLGFFFAAACASAPKPPSTVAAAPPAKPPTHLVATYADGARALEMGDTVEAARLFNAVPEKDPDYAKARSQLATLAPDIASITQSWLKQVERSARGEHYQAAHKRLEHMLEHFVLDDATRTQVEQRLVAVDQDAAIAVANLETLDQQTPSFVAAGDLTHALQNMRRAVAIARDASPDTVLERERRIAALEQRIGVPEKPAQPVASVKKDTKRPRKRAEKEPPAVTAPAPTVVASASTSTEDDDPPPEESRVEGLLEEADAFRDNKAYFNAIVAYMRVRTIERDNGRAKAALADLEPKRQELVQQYLSTANQHFQQQDLAGAVPYFRKVLSLEPDNQQATKGLEMHYNLERIRREKRAAQ